MSRIAVIGSGPGAFYTIKYLLKHHSNISVTILERLVTPFGLVRFGVAPDHAEVKEVGTEFANILMSHKTQVKMHTNQYVGGDLFKLLRESFDGILVATGAQSAARLPFKSLPQNTLSARDFVLWYNGHPDFAHLRLPDQPRNVSIVGHGNVALDVARMLSKSKSELEPLVSSGLLNPMAFNWFCRRQALEGPKSVSILGRGGYLHAAFTNKEFRELTTMKDATCKVNQDELEASFSELKTRAANDRAKSRGLSILEKCVSNSRDDSKSNSIFLRFNCKPVEYQGDPAVSLVVSRTLTGETEHVSCDLGIESIGFKVMNDFGLPIDSKTGGIAHDGLGRVSGFPGVYVAGWSKRGPRGVIAANIPCCIETAEAMFADLSDPSKLPKPNQEPPVFSDPYTPS